MGAAGHPPMVIVGRVRWADGPLWLGSGQPAQSDVPAGTSARTGCRHVVCQPLSHVLHKLWRLVKPQAALVGSKLIPCRCFLVVLPLSVLQQALHCTQKALNQLVHHKSLIPLLIPIVANNPQLQDGELLKRSACGSLFCVAASPASAVPYSSASPCIQPSRALQRDRSHTLAAFRYL